MRFLVIAVTFESIGLADQWPRAVPAFTASAQTIETRVQESDRHDQDQAKPFALTGPMSSFVGAGPTGLALACDLSNRGIAVRIIDKAPGRRPPRGRS